MNCHALLFLSVFQKQPQTKTKATKKRTRKSNPQKDSPLKTCQHTCRFGYHSD